MKKTQTIRFSLHLGLIEKIEAVRGLPVHRIIEDIYFAIEEWCKEESLTLVQVIPFTNGGQSQDFLIVYHEK